MTRRKHEPVLNAPPRLRQRQRADGTWRVWWEPRAEDRPLGFAAVELSADRPDWSRREAARLNAELARARAAGTRRQGTASRGRRIADLVAIYRAAPEFLGLADKTRKSYGTLLRMIETKWGNDLVADFDKATMKVWYESLYRDRGATVAVRLIRMMSILFSQAETRGWRPENSNPCFRLRLRTPAPRDRFATWDELDALIAAADAEGLAAMALAIGLSFYAGQRETDVMRATRDAFVPMPGGVWVWRLRRSKRQNLGAVPVHPDVLPRLRRALADAGDPARPRGPADALLLDEALGRPYDEDLFAKRWARVRARAAQGLPAIATLQFRDLRRSFGVHARAGGTSKEDVGDVLGNSAASNPLLGETYMPPTLATASRAVAALRRPASPAKKDATHE